MNDLLRVQQAQRRGYPYGIRVSTDFVVTKEYQALCVLVTDGDDSARWSLERGKDNSTELNEIDYFVDELRHDKIWTN